MKKDEPEVIRLISTGVPGLDRVLGGGLPEYSFNLIAGGPGAGKTTLAHQVVFANATPERPALYFTVLGEPTIKMLRYQRQFGFFDTALAGSAVQFVNLSEEVLDGNLSSVLDRIVREVETVRPGIVVVDSFRTIGGRAGSVEQQGDRSIEQFVQRLSLYLTSWEVTSFLLGEYGELAWDWVWRSAASSHARWAAICRWPAPKDEDRVLRSPSRVIPSEVASSGRIAAPEPQSSC